MHGLGKIHSKGFTTAGRMVILMGPLIRIMPRTTVSVSWSMAMRTAGIDESTPSTFAIPFALSLALPLPFAVAQLPPTFGRGPIRIVFCPWVWTHRMDVSPFSTVPADHVILILFWTVISPDGQSWNVFEWPVLPSLLFFFFSLAFPALLLPFPSFAKNNARHPRQLQSNEVSPGSTLGSHGRRSPRREAR